MTRLILVWDLPRNSKWPTSLVYRKAYSITELNSSVKMLCWGRMLHTHNYSIYQKTSRLHCCCHHYCNTARPAQSYTGALTCSTTSMARHKGQEGCETTMILDMVTTCVFCVRDTGTTWHCMRDLHTHNYNTQVTRLCQDNKSWKSSEQHNYDVLTHPKFKNTDLLYVAVR